MAPGGLHVCVALYEYKDMEHSSEAWCAPGFRVDVLELTNEDWHKVLLQQRCVAVLMSLILFKILFHRFLL